MDKVLIVRLKISQHPDIIGIVKDLSDNKIQIDKPHMPAMKKDSGTQAELTFVPYIPSYASDNPDCIVLDKSDVLLTFEPIDELRQRFNIQFGSGLVLPNSNNTVKIPTANLGTVPA